MNTTSSFLPEDYLARKSERRTNVISLTLFVIVMLGVFLAFLFTNRKWTQVKNAQTTINARYLKAADEIKELTELEEQKDEMLQKADLAAALVETVPRSILLAELINRMPDRLSLLEFDLTSEKAKTPVTRVEPTQTSGRLSPTRPMTREEALDVKKKIEPPRYNVSITLVGAAPTDLEVSRYLAELNAYPLLNNVTLEYSEEKEIEEQLLRQFEIKMRLDPDADVRQVNPLVVPRVDRDPMSDQISIPGARDRGGRVMAGDRNGRGD
jgi:Tfp pilus assembly protein PilN